MPEIHPLSVDHECAQLADDVVVVFTILLGVKRRSAAIFPKLLGPEAPPDHLDQALATALELHAGQRRHAKR